MNLSVMHICTSCCSHEIYIDVKKLVQAASIAISLDSLEILLDGRMWHEDFILDIHRHNFRVAMPDTHNLIPAVLIQHELQSAPTIINID